MSAIDEARSKIHAAIAEIDAEREKLSKALVHLGERIIPTKRGRPSKARSGPRRGRSKPAPKGKRKEQFLKAVEEKPGITTTEVAKKIGVAPNQLYVVARNLAKEGAVKKEGSGYTIRPKGAEKA